MHKFSALKAICLMQIAHANITLASIMDAFKKGRGSVPVEDYFSGGIMFCFFVFVFVSALVGVRDIIFNQNHENFKPFVKIVTVLLLCFCSIAVFSAIFSF